MQGSSASQFNTPALLRAASGNAGVRDLSRDVLGRVAFRANQLPDNHGDYKQDKRGGMPKQRGRETNLPYLLEAAHKLGLPAESARKALPYIKQVPNQRGGMFGHTRNSDPRVQALDGLRRLALRRVI